MNKQRLRGLARRPQREGRRRIRVVESVGSFTTTDYQSISLHDKLIMLNLPEDIIDIILNAHYNNDTGKVFLFSDINRPELQEIISVYDHFTEQNELEDAKRLFIDHVNKIIEIEQRKSKLNLQYQYDTIYEAPYLSEYKRQETLKQNLEGRKRAPVKGINCRRGGCSSDEVYHEEKFTRSGDEGGVEYFVCAKCNYKWIDRG